MTNDLTWAKFQVGFGWHKLLEELYSKLPQGVEISDIKEKWGGLRVDYYNGDTDFSKLVDELEHRSLSICELCGEPGSARDGGWIKTLCDKHVGVRNTWIPPEE